MLFVHLHDPAGEIATVCGQCTASNLLSLLHSWTVMAAGLYNNIAVGTFNGRMADLSLAECHTLLKLLSH